MRSNRQRIPLRRSIALVGDGQTEAYYFADLRDTDRPDDLYIKPEFPRKYGGFAHILNRGIELTEDYAEVYALIDMDAIIAQGQQAVYRAHKQRAQAAGVVVFEQNPCFEVWLLLHFEQTGRAFGNCDEVIDRLRRHIPDYTKSMRYQTAKRLYQSYRHLISGAAIPNARRLENRREERGEQFPRAEVFKFFETVYKDRL